MKQKLSGHHRVLLAVSEARASARGWRYVYVWFRKKDSAVTLCQSVLVERL